MADVQQASQIRSKILGALLVDARKSSGRSAQECADILGIPEADYAGFESGATTPTLPQLEVLAYFFNVPVEHFWDTQTLAAARRENEIKAAIPQLIALRDKVIGATLRSIRDEVGAEIEKLAEQTGIPSDRLEAYELGNEPVPVHDLQLIANALGIRMEELVGDHGPVGAWLRRQSEFVLFSELSDDLRDFILKPINRSYLELAMRLSGLSVQRLRGIAEGILDITY